MRLNEVGRYSWSIVCQSDTCKSKPESGEAPPPLRTGGPGFVREKEPSLDPHQVIDLI